jgi:protein-S-isoprenylcysteine O-methyltransferase Ste14
MIAVLVALHLAFFSPFLLRLLGMIGPDGARGGGPQTAETHSDPRADALLVLHGAAFAIFYWGLLSELTGNGAPRAGVVAALSGAFLLLLAIVLLTWSLWVFRSWRLLAELDRGHELCTSGPFRWVRHPIYLACDLLALGTAIWIGTPRVWVGAILVVLGGDLRARAEERILLAAFGERYRDYIRRSSRLIPGLY